jgi:hypothetical protein
MPRAFADHYPTPQWMIQLLQPHSRSAKSVLEPCAGSADCQPIADFYRDRCRVYTNDAFFTGSDTQEDATQASYWESAPVVDWVVTNPPFNGAQEILRHAYDHASVGVAFLLRVTADEMVLSDRERAKWWASHPETAIIKMPRYAFAPSSQTGKATVDSAYAQWHVWYKINPSGLTRITRHTADSIPDYHRYPVHYV